MAPRIANAGTAKGATTKNAASKRKQPKQVSKTSGVNGITSLERKHVAATERRPAKQARLALNPIPGKTLAVLPFGGGDFGELGLGPSVNETRRPRLNQFLNPASETAFHVVQLACGGMHTLALTADNKIISWGVNDLGALGRDSAWDGGWRDAMVDASSDSESDSGDINPRESTPAEVSASHFPEGTRFAQVTAGDSCSFVLTDDGLVYGWGTFVNAEGAKCFSLDKNGEPIERQATPTLIPGLTNVIQIAAGANHVLALDQKGTVWAWGWGAENQLGRRVLGRHQNDGFTPRRVEVGKDGVKYIASGQYHSFAVDGRDDVYGWGRNSFGEAGFAKLAGSDTTLLPYPMKIRDLCGKGVFQMDGGANHSVAVCQDGRVLAWGRIDGGQLGIRFSDEQLEDPALVRRDDRGRPRICLRPTSVSHISNAAYATCGTDHTIFVDKAGKVYSSGFASSNQLGLGSEDDVHVATEIKSKDLKGKKVVWAGAGGQFSMVGALADVPSD